MLHILAQLFLTNGYHIFDVQKCKPEHLLHALTRAHNRDADHLLGHGNTGKGNAGRCRNDLTTHQQASFIESARGALRTNMHIGHRELSANFVAR